MPYDIVVCIKQVPHPEYLGKVSLDPVKGTISREGIPAIINPSDRNALEEALRIRERFSGHITVLTMGPPQARKALEEALAMETDAAIHLCDRAFGGADTLATAWTLACAIKKIERFDLVLCGDTTIDSGTGQTALQLAECLNLPGIINVAEILFEDDRTVIVKCLWERGYFKVWVKLPAVIAVTGKINQPRLPSISGIMAAAEKEITVWQAADIGADIAKVGLRGSPTQFCQMGEFHSRRQGVTLRGSAGETVKLAVEKLAKLGVL